jgi:hypothetical protein
MRRLVIRFKDGSTTSLDLVPGREREDLLRPLRHFPGKEVASVEEQVYDPEHPRRFRYVRREDLEGLLLIRNPPDPFPQHPPGHQWKRVWLRIRPGWVCR